MLFGCNLCGTVDDFSNQYLYNDLTVCGKCFSILHKARKDMTKTLHRHTRTSGIFEDKD
jgi:hypothetical protein